MLQRQSEDVAALKSGAEDATDTDITLDDDNCVSGFKARGNDGFGEIQDRFGKMVAADDVFGVEFFSDDRCVSSCFENNTALILRGTPGWYTGGNALQCAIPFMAEIGVPQTVGGLVAHELIGHGAGVVLGGQPALEPEAKGIENQYHRGRGRTPKC